MISVSPAVSPTQDQQTSRPRILCIDDDADVTFAIQQLLSRYNVDVDCDRCGQLGVWDAYQKQPDVIITDMRMPNGDGQHVLEQIKGNRLTAHIPVIVFSGKRDPQLPGRMKNLGASPFLFKPVESETLLAAVKRFVSLEERNGRPNPLQDD